MGGEFDMQSLSKEKRRHRNGAAFLVLGQTVKSFSRRENWKLPRFWREIIIESVSSLNRESESSFAGLASEGDTELELLKEQCVCGLNRSCHSSELKGLRWSQGNTVHPGGFVTRKGADGTRYDVHV